MGIRLSGALLPPLLAVVAFAGLAAAVAGGATSRLDAAVLLWIDRHAAPPLDAVALQVTALGNGLVVAIIALVAGSVLWAVGRRALAALLAAGVAGVWAIYPLLKLAFDRPRPQLFPWRTDYAHSSSFPSGHAAMSMVLGVLLAYVLHRLDGRRGTRAAAGLAAGAAVLLVGLSRLYLGVHYPSDVIAGYLVGFCWACVCVRAAEGLAGRRGAGEP